jgi:hypothetical protein
MSLRFFSIAAAVLIVLATGGGARAATDPCALVTQAEASKAVGASVAAGVPSKGPLGAACRYATADHMKWVYVQTMSASSVTTMASAMHPKSLSGFPGTAYWMSGSVFFSKGQSAGQVGLHLGATSMSAMDPGIVPLAKIAAGRL